MTTFRFRWALVMAAISLLLAPTAGRALTFSSSVERFEADGNGYGSADGVFDLVDEFDGGTLAPNWSVLLGSAEESGGVLRLHDPGVVEPLVALTQEISAVEGAVELGNGDGNFTITSYWDPAPLTTNRQFFFQLYGIGATVEAEGFTVNNLDAATAAAAGAPVGYSIGRERVFPLGGDPPVQDYVAIDPSTITGPIVLRMVFDDATDLLTCSFSLDGGLTFQTPFAPIQAFKVVPDAEVLLGAAALPEPPPPPPPCASIGNAKVKFTKLDSLGQQKLSAKGNLLLAPGTPSTFDPVNQPTLVDVVGVSSQHLTEYEVPTGVPGTSVCGSGDGWTVSGRTSRYLNRSGFVYVASPTPYCLGGTGLRQMKFTDDRARRGRIKFSLTVDGANNLVPPGTEDAALVVQLGWNGQTAEACAGALLPCVASPGRSICK